ncbi:MAG: hypothetical protein K6E35_00080 [Bacteroidales bacterium]|nr:hypothetical protein [Bacteroidales bacterium]
MRYCYFLICLPALLGSCRKESRPTPDETPLPVEVSVDSVLTHIHIQATRPVHTLDLFIYEAGGLQGLERHLQLDSLPTQINLPTTPGEKRIVGIANSPHHLNLKALERYEAMEKFAFSFPDDNPARPILGGSVQTERQTGSFTLRPLLSQVILESVSNTMDDYELLENPRVRLRDLPGGAEILRERDFRPTDLLDAGPWTTLPCDVGFFTQEPCISLWCYPNDTPEDILGTPRPTLEFACEIRGEACSFDIPLPPLPRGSRVEVALTVDGPGSYHYKFQ